MNKNFVGLIYKDEDYSDIFEINPDGVIKNIKMNNYIFSKTNSVVLNYKGISIRVHIPTAINILFYNCEHPIFTIEEKEEILRLARTILTDE